MLTKRAPNQDLLLTVYREIHLGRRPVFDEEQSITKSHLKLSGVVRRDNNVLRLRNRIYGQVFDRRWINENLPFSLRERWEQLKPALPYIVGSLVFSLATIGGTLYVNKQRIITQGALKDAEEQRKAAQDALKDAEEQRQAAQKEAQKARKQQRRAEKQTKEMEKQRTRAEKGEKQAKSALDKAEAAQKAETKQRRLAEQRKTQAEVARKAETKQRQLAEQRKTQAEDAQKLAETRRAEAEKQRKIAQEQEQKADIARKQAESQAKNALEQQKRAEKREREAKSNLKLAQAAINESDIAYHLQWKVGQQLLEHGDSQGAIVAYTKAVESLKSSRNKLAFFYRNPNTKFTFRDQVEPVYRELINLLLQPSDLSSGREMSQRDINKARDTIEALQLAEVDSFFPDASPIVQQKRIDENNPDTAVIYPIILPDRLAIILKLPHKRELILKTFVVKSTEVEKIIKGMQSNIVQPERFKEFTKDSQQLYQWLIEPIEDELEKSKVGVRTLVFIPDGSLRNIPMAALYDGEKYLVEKYAIAISPGLQLFTPKPLTRQQLNVLAGGLSEVPKREQKNFVPLPNVRSELSSIEKSGLPTVRLYNKDFTSSNLQEQINKRPFQIVHLATYGGFSSRGNETFILASDGRINASELYDLLRSREGRRTQPIDLLVLSASKTAAGDEGPPFGLAGLALRAGVRSTLASVCQIDDASTAEFIDEFYRQLMTNKTITTAEALRVAQLKLMNSGYNRPMHWAPYVLVGNWL